MTHGHPDPQDIPDELLKAFTDAQTPVDLKLFDRYKRYGRP